MKPKLSPRELQRLREAVACVHCGAVPQETGETRPVCDPDGNAYELPFVETTHAAECPFAPRAGVARPHHTMTPAGPCTMCGKPMLSSAGRRRLYCGEGCRMKAKRDRREGRPVRQCGTEERGGAVDCEVCGKSTPTKLGWKKRYCSKRCRDRAARAMEKARAATDSTAVAS